MHAVELSTRSGSGQPRKVACQEGTNTDLFRRFFDVLHCHVSLIKISNVCEHEEYF